MGNLPFSDNRRPGACGGLLAGGILVPGFSAFQRHVPSMYCRSGRRLPWYLYRYQAAGSLLGAPAGRAPFADRRWNSLPTTTLQHPLPYLSRRWNSLPTTELPHASLYVSRSSGSQCETHYSPLRVLFPMPYLKGRNALLCVYKRQNQANNATSIVMGIETHQSQRKGGVISTCHDPSSSFGLDKKS